MGNCMNKKKGGKQPVTLAILGLDNAGKTVTTIGLQGENLDTVAPTLGFSSINFVHDKYDVTLFDLGGGKKIRGIWENYFADIYGVIYVVDSSAKERIDECHTVFLNLLQHSHVRGKPLLVLANKQDKLGALDEVDICDQLNLEELVNKFKTPCRVEPCSAIVGQGKKLDKSIKQGVSWLLAMVAKDWDVLHTRVEKDLEVKRTKEAKEKKERVERVRKIKEERERKEKEERLARGEAEPESDDEGMMDGGGGPFKRLDFKEVEKKERQLKEEKKRKKEQEMLMRKSVSDTNTGRNSDNYLGEDYDAGVPSSSHKSRRSLPALHGSLDMHHPVGKLGQFDSPRPNRRFVKGASRSMQSPSSYSDEETTNQVHTNSSLTNAHWLRDGDSRTHQHHNLGGLGGADPSSPQSGGGLTPFGYQSGEFGSQQRRGVLAPLTPLEPLESLDQRNKKKKKKAKKNQTMPDAALTEEAAGWPAPRASRSPRLDTVQEPDNESDPGQVSFAQKYNLLDDLPQFPSARSQRMRPNTDYDDSLVT